MLRRIGVRGRLLLSFIGISGFAILAGATAMHSFAQVRRALDEITEQRLPTALSAQELATDVKRIVAEAPALLTAGSAQEHSRLWSMLDRDLEKVGEQMRLLEQHGLPADSLLSLHAALEPLQSNLSSLNILAGERIVLTDRKTVLLDELSKAHEDTQALLGSWITNVGNDIKRLRTAADDPKLPAEKQLLVGTELIQSITTLASLQQIQQTAIESQRNLVAMSAAEDGKQLDLLGLRALWSIGVLGSLAGEVQSHVKDLVFAETERFNRFTEGENGMPSLRMREFQILTKAQDLLDQNTALSRQLTESVQSLVQRTRLDIAEATSRAKSVQQASSITLILVVSLSLLSSVLIVWLYVGRNLIARLKNLSSSMLAIAGGNLETPLPSSGGDEIGQMAEALAVFRDNAVEIRKSNLREIDQARRRLTAAIESISEGFSLYDADDRLVVCNSTYRSLLYQGIEDTVTPGASFEAIIRNAAERGLVRDAEGRVEEWVAERLARHHDPGEPHLQRRGDRWILISERKTDDSGTVAVYADITELKQREEELTDKSSALEQLSNQLAKYLSPQVYDSIFKGKQEVKVASYRKKLSIFFSDIAGFTETADRLESEELTQLVNHYLTEMSRIALDHGATIDKYVGDAIMIFFGDPESRGVKEDALACVNMAIAMRRRMLDLEDIWRQSGIDKPLRVRMGVHTGYCTVGNFGSEDRMDYTIIGGAVNTASRLQSLADPGEILISYETFANVRGEIHCEEHGEIEVRGIAYPVATYRVVDSYRNLGQERRHFCEEHPNVKVDLDLEGMTADDRNRAAGVLHRALRLLASLEQGGMPDRKSPEGPD